MKRIFALTDYKDNFGSKWKAKPYRSGFDKLLLQEYFSKYGFETEFVQLKDAPAKKNNMKGELVIYTSSEETGLWYKSYIEDILLYLVQAGAEIIPHFSFLRANNNKVFMELLMAQTLGMDLIGKESNVYGTLEEVVLDISLNKVVFPCVIKSAAGSMSRGVRLVRTEKELIKTVKKISRSSKLIHELKELGREIKHPGYRRESKYQKKFIVQPFVPGLKNDWKILIYGDHYYILYRGIKERDFRASGSHFNYKAGAMSEFPIHVLDTVEQIYKKLDVPHLSLDFAYDGKRTYVHEIQAIYFGTSTLEFSEDYYVKKDGNWTTEKKEFDEEEEYVWGLVKYLNNHFTMLEP